MTGLKLILAAVLVAVNAFFVIAEYALVRSRRARLEVMREQDMRGAALALGQLERINDYISAVQIGVTMTSIGIGALATPTLAHALQEAFGGSISHDVTVVIAVVIAYAIVISVQLIFGRDGAEVLCDRPRRVGRPPHRRAAAGLRRAVPPDHPRDDHGVGADPKLLAST